MKELFLNKRQIKKQGSPGQLFIPICFVQVCKYFNKSVFPGIVFVN